MKDVHIRCPKCNWEPNQSSLWVCSACSAWFNTFSTAARCPVCGKIHKNTQCHECAKWSPHLDWYEGLDSIVSELKEEIEKSWSMPVEP